MLPLIAPTRHVETLYLEFLDALERRGFLGRIHCDYATRLVTATDNSVYQVLPQAVDPGLLSQSHLPTVLRHF